MTPRFCFYVSVHEKDERGYIPSMVYEDEPGHRPLRGNGPFAEPYYWGKVYSQAVDVCRRANEELGLTQDDVVDIVASSMRLQGWD